MTAPGKASTLCMLVIWAALGPGAGLASGPGCVSACVECGKLYASDLEGRLWKIDPGTGVADFIGWS